MSPGPLKLAAQYFLGLILVVFFVVLLSFIFSFLGTIFCAALAGMMLGAFRNLRWHAMLASFLFPAVSMGLLRGMRADLPDKQILIVALVCFGVFWLTYLVAATLFVYESKHRTLLAVEMAAKSPGRDLGSQSPGRSEIALNGLNVPEPEPRLTMGFLQGEWLCDADQDGGFREKVLNIQQEKLTLRVADPDGRVRVLAMAKVRLDELKPLQTLVIFDGADGCSSDTLVCI